MTSRRRLLRLCSATSACGTAAHIFCTSHQLQDDQKCSKMVFIMVLVAILLTASHALRHCLPSLDLLAESSLALGSSFTSPIQIHYLRSQIASDKIPPRSPNTPATHRHTHSHGVFHAPSSSGHARNTSWHTSSATSGRYVSAFSNTDSPTSSHATAKCRETLKGKTFHRQLDRQ